jgi:hypothetical protein
MIIGNTTKVKIGKKNASYYERLRDNNPAI